MLITEAKLTCQEYSASYDMISALFNLFKFCATDSSFAETDVVLNDHFCVVLT